MKDGSPGVSRGFMRQGWLASTAALALAGTLLAAAPEPASASGTGFKVLHSFANTIGNLNGQAPDGDLVFGADNNLYGTTNLGGDAIACDGGEGCGTVFRLVFPHQGGTGTPKFEHLGEFNVVNGAFPFTSLAADTDGNIFGTTGEGGTCLTIGNGCGVVFQLTPPATKHGKAKLAAIHQFSTSFQDGGDPQAGPIVDKKTGIVYGSTCYGGSTGAGTVWSLTPGKKGKWTFEILVSFSAAQGGDTCPDAPLVMDPAGNLYGATSSGGGHGAGDIFKLTPKSKHNWVRSNLHTIGATAGDGFSATGMVIFQGNLYGAYRGGGTNNDGALFRQNIANPADYQVLHAFVGSSEGAFPQGDRIAVDKHGNLYGVTQNGGENSEGTIYLWDGSNLNVIYALCSLEHCADGENGASLIVGPDHATLYGTTQNGGVNGGGIVFSLPIPPAPCVLSRGNAVHNGC